MIKVWIYYILNNFDNCSNKYLDFKLTFKSMNGLEILLILGIQHYLQLLKKKYKKQVFIKSNVITVNFHVDSIDQTDGTFHGTNKIIKQITIK